MSEELDKLKEKYPNPKYWDKAIHLGKPTCIHAYKATLAPVEIDSPCNYTWKILTVYCSICGVIFQEQK